MNRPARTEYFSQSRIGEKGGGFGRRLVFVGAMSEKAEKRR